MKVTLGYSREHPGGTKWTKADVMTEEDDLRRLLTDNGVDPDIQIKPHLVFLLLRGEAEDYLIANQVKEGLISKEESIPMRTIIGETKKKIIESLKENSGNAASA